MKIDEKAFEAGTWNYTPEGRSIARRTIEKYLAALPELADRITALEEVAEMVLARASIEDDPALLQAAARALGRGEVG